VRRAGGRRVQADLTKGESMSMRSTLRRVAAPIAAAAIASTLMAQGATAKPPPDATSTAKPAINMERLLLAAQLDQYRPGNGKTRGAVKSVKRVQRALRRRGIHVVVDGNYGAQTMSGYAAWQRRLGYSGLDASGIPGETSLKRLAGRRYRVIRVVRPGERRVWSGVTLNVRTIRMLRTAGRQVRRGCVLDATKGSYTGPDGDSQATHAGGGAVDLSVRTLCGRSVKRVVRSLRRVGFAAWYRNWPGNRHIHAIAISDPDMANEIAFPGWFDAREQIVAWAQRKDGLSGATTGPQTRRLRTWERYKRSR
jgi:peptidoglycan hydrolase-like protein with peptidoglycan-binding domain